MQNHPICRLMGTKRLDREEKKGRPDPDDDDTEPEITRRREAGGNNGPTTDTDRCTTRGEGPAKTARPAPHTGDCYASGEGNNTVAVDDPTGQATTDRRQTQAGQQTGGGARQVGAFHPPDRTCYVSAYRT